MSREIKFSCCFPLNRESRLSVNWTIGKGFPQKNNCSLNARKAPFPYNRGVSRRDKACTSSKGLCPDNSLERPLLP